MFEKLLRRQYHIKKHINAPLLEERKEYIQHYIDSGCATTTITSVAQYLLRIVEFLPLTSTDRVVTIKELESAADLWANHQYNHPQKQSFSKTGKKRFMWFAIDWLKSINCLEPLPEECIPLFNKLFERRHALRRHTSMQLLPERLLYLQYWADNGATDNTLRKIACYLLIIMEYLDFFKLRVISLEEVEQAACRWATNEKVHCKGSNYSFGSRAKFIHDASAWLDMLDCLENPIKQNIPFGEYLDQYILYMHSECGLSENTIETRRILLKEFLIAIKVKSSTLIDITSLDIDDILIKKQEYVSYSRRSLQLYASVIRSFISCISNKGWCQKNLASTIKTTRVYRGELLPYAPNWDDVKKVLLSTNTDNPVDIRDYAILILLSVYGLRCSEVKMLCLEHIDWKNELLYIERAKNSKPQTFPLSKTVGEAILKYLKDVRPNNSKLREVFLCMRSPYRPLTNPGMYQIVSRKLRPVAPNIKHHGPHALRHACATHPINDGISIKEISDHLGHKGLETTRLYSKVDLTNLRKVAEFELGDLL